MLSFLLFYEQKKKKKKRMSWICSLELSNQKKAQRKSYQKLEPTEVLAVKSSCFDYDKISVRYQYLYLLLSRKIQIDKI